MAYPVQTDPTAVFGRRVRRRALDRRRLVLIPVILLAQLAASSTSRCRPRRSTAQTSSATPTSDAAGRRLRPRRGIGDRVYFTDEHRLQHRSVSSGLTVAACSSILQGLTGWTLGKLLHRASAPSGRTATPPGIGKALRPLAAAGSSTASPTSCRSSASSSRSPRQGHRRVGDMAAKTFVVRRTAAGSPDRRARPHDGTGRRRWPTAPPPSPPRRNVPPQAPQWDAARGTYIQWDAGQGRWLQWDEATRTWSPIAGQ